MVQSRTLGYTEWLPQTRAAVEYAERCHIGQLRRADGAPFIAHPLEVASLLYQAGAPDHLIAAGVLHDTIEKSHVAEADLRARFGSRVAKLVVAVSEDEQIAGYTERKAALCEQVTSAGEDALTLFAADKLSKARELSLEATAASETRTAGGRPITRSRELRLTHYRHCLSLLQGRLPDSPLVSQLRIALWRAESPQRDPGERPAPAPSERTMTPSRD